MAGAHGVLRIGEQILYSVRDSTYVILECRRMVGRKLSQCNQCDGIANKELDQTVGVACENTRCSPKHICSSHCSHDRSPEQHAASCTLLAHTSRYLTGAGDATASGLGSILYPLWSTCAVSSSRHVNDPQPSGAGAVGGQGSAILGTHRAVPRAINPVS